LQICLTFCVLDTWMYYEFLKRYNMLNWLRDVGTLDTKYALKSLWIFLTVPKKKKHSWSSLKRQQYGHYKCTWYLHSCVRIVFVMYFLGLCMHVQMFFSGYTVYIDKSCYLQFMFLDEFCTLNRGLHPVQQLQLLRLVSTLLLNASYDCDGWCWHDQIQKKNLGSSSWQDLGHECRSLYVVALLHFP
jgi:hypothetical protein